MNVWAAWIYRKPIFDFLGAKLTVSCKNHFLTKKKNGDKKVHYS